VPCVLNAPVSVLRLVAKVSRPPMALMLPQRRQRRTSVGLRFMDSYQGNLTPTFSPKASVSIQPKLLQCRQRCQCITRAHSHYRRGGCLLILCRREITSITSKSGVGSSPLVLDGVGLVTTNASRAARNAITSGSEAKSTSRAEPCFAQSMINCSFGLFDSLVDWLVASIVLFVCHFDCLMGVFLTAYGCHFDTHGSHFDCL